MVRPKNVARSRACEQCKKKRIKCDLQSPTCQRCLDSNIVCSGPASGLLMVNESKESFATHHGAGNRAKTLSITHESAMRSSAVICKDIVSHDLYDEGLLLQFLNYFSQNAGRHTWFVRLPALARAKNHAAMKTAARAVSLAFAAQAIKDPAMARAACEYYGNSLRYHQASFKAPNGRQICKKKAINALPVTILLSYFEMIQATSPDAWLRHSLAAERLFVLLGPNALQDELLNYLYFIVRANSATRCFLMGGRTQLVDQSWSAIPMVHQCGRPNVIFNNLVDLIIWLSSYVNVSGLPANVSSLNRTLILKIFTQLERLWQFFGEVIDHNHREYPLLDPGADDSLSAEVVFDKITFPSLPPKLLDCSAALTGSFFHAAVILVYTLLWRNEYQQVDADHFFDSDSCNGAEEHSPSVNAGSDEISVSDCAQAIRYHASHIFAYTSFLRQKHVGCACLRMILPLSIVNRLSPSVEQREYAETFFREWSTSDGLAGLPIFAFGEKHPTTGATAFG